jgi:hypothetical protein
MAEETPQRKHLVIERTGGRNVREVDATINENGDLYIYGADLGPASADIFGSSDYEYHLTIKAEDKDMILLLVLKALHDNPDSISSRVMDLAREHNIRYEFHSF